MKLISWNVAGRIGKLERQADLLLDRAPDVVALQEVTAKTAPTWRKRLASSEFHVVSSADRLGGKKFACLLAARWPITRIRPPEYEVPRPERLLAGVVASNPPIEVHVAHLPPGVSVGVQKIEVFEAIFRALARPAEQARILCGDFNTPQSETASGEVTTWADHHPEHFDRWDAAERSVLVGLAEFDLPDAYRGLHGYERRDVSWEWRGAAGRRVGRRFDHVFASQSLTPTTCEYIHDWREEGLSDHSAIEVVFALG